MKANNNKIEVIKGDITKVKCDAIVNAANSTLMGGGGVDGAIHKNGGSEILAECKKLVKENGGCRTGEAVITNAGMLPCKKVIHTVGPIWYGGFRSEPEQLHNAYLNSLKLAEKNGLRSIAFPNISTGVYGYPKTEAVKVAIETVSKYIEDNTNIERVIFICHDNDNFQLYTDYLDLS